MLVGVLTLISCLGGIFIPGLYRGKASFIPGWQSNDWVTLLLAVPLLVWSLAASRRGSLRGLTMWAGTVFYLLYNYSFYVCAALNWFFVLHVTIVALAMLSLLFGLVSFNAGEIGRRFRVGPSAKWITAWMWLWAAFVALMWSAQAVQSLVTGRPALIWEDQTAFRAVAAFDGWLMVTPLVLGAMWLWRSHPWGSIVAIMCNVEGALYMVVLAATTAVSPDPGAMNLMPVWLFFLTGCTLSLVFLVRNTGSAAAEGSETMKLSAVAN